MGNVVAIVGRPNVGKSTFFNRLIGTRDAIMDNQSGVTRDRHYGKSDWLDKSFIVIDTGGYVEGSDDVFEEAIRKQVNEALEESDVILFVVDAKTGLHPLDVEFAKVLRKINKPTLVVANKVDAFNKSDGIYEFYELALGEVYPISSMTGSGTGDLLDMVVSHFPKEPFKDPFEGLPRIAIIGKPNVGKSSILNFLIGEERSIVTDIPGTTRDTVDTLYNAFGKKMVLTDTAGLRRKSRVKESIEFYSTLRSLKAIDNSEVIIFMIDAAEGFTSQDATMIGYIHERRKGIVMLVNKWDLVIEKTTNSSRDFEQEIYNKIAPINYFPIIFTSVLQKQRIYNVLDKVEEVHQNLTKTIKTSKLNEVMLQEIEHRPPPSSQGRFIQIKYITQVDARCPSFIFFCNMPNEISESYKRFLENKLREHFGFEGVPINVIFRKK